MKRIAFTVLVSLVALVTLRTQYHYTEGYTRTDGIYVAGYWHGVPDGQAWNNLSTWGVSIRGN